MTVARAPPPLASGRVHEPSHTGSLHRYCAPPRSDIYNPDGTSRLLAGWLRGAGDDQAAAGLGFVKGHDQHGGVANDDIEEEGSVDAVGDDVPDLAGYGVPEIEEDAFCNVWIQHTRQSRQKRTTDRRPGQDNVGQSYKGRQKGAGYEDSGTTFGRPKVVPARESIHLQSFNMTRTQVVLSP